MGDWIIDDLKVIIKSEDSLSKFIKMNDVKEIYNFCRDSNKTRKEALYTEEEFYNKVDKLIDTIPCCLFDDDEW